jgi:methylmalonyl-CoA/ethylmalonyl-CoA epimerase
VTDIAEAGGAAGVLAVVGAVYDHVAHAVPSIREVLPIYRELLGGVVYSGGLHHVTFKVPDIQLALERVLAAGYHPAGTYLEQAEWRETFLHPRETGGVLVQLAQAAPGVPGLLTQPLDELLEEAARLRAEDLARG